MYKVPKNFQEMQEIASKFDRKIPSFMRSYLRSPLYQQIKAMEENYLSSLFKITKSPIYKQLDSINKLSLDSKLKVLFHSSLFSSIRDLSSEDKDVQEIKNIVENVDHLVIGQELNYEELNNEEKVELEKLNNRTSDRKLIKNIKTLSEIILALLSGINVSINYSDNSSTLNQSATYVENQVINHQVFNGTVKQVCGFNNVRDKESIEEENKQD